MMERDAELLSYHNIMDYSLLFAVEKNPEYHLLKGAGSRGTRSTGSQDDELEKECKRCFYTKF